MHPHGTPNRTTSKRLAIVARVSTEDQEEYGTSLDDQVAKGQLLAQLHDYSVDDRSYTEGGHIYKGDESGRLPLTQRPIMRRLIDDAKERKFDAVAFYKLDRMARRLKYILEIWDKLEDLGITVLIIDPMIDTSTAVGRLIRNVLGAVAEFEVDTILERTTGGRKRKFARKEGWLSGVHYGYRYVKADRMAGAPAGITVHAAEATVIERIFTRRAQGISYERIAMELTAEGIPSPKGRGAWNFSTIAKMLANGAYRGEAQWGKREYMRGPDGKRTSRLRRDGRPTFAIKYPPIVSPELWAAANSVATCGARPVRASVEKFLLRGGMVCCAEHGLVMSGSTSGSGRTRYRCMRTMGGQQRERSVHSVPARALDEAVWNDVVDFLADPERGMAAARQLALEAEADLAEIADRRSRIAQRLAALDQEAAELLRLARRGTIKPERIDASMAEVEEESARLRAELAPLEAQEALARAELPQAGEIARVCQDLADGATYAMPAERRELLDSLQVQVTMRGLDYTITGVVPELTLKGSLHHSGGSTQYPAEPLTPVGVQGWTASESATRRAATRLLRWSWPGRSSTCAPASRATGRYARWPRRSTAGRPCARRCACSCRRRAGTIC
jgi:site-specific DNA recombinase